MLTERLRIPAVDDPDLLVEVDYRGGAVMRIVGSADNTATAELAKLLEALHDELREKRVREIVVDLTALDWLAPSGFKQLVAWLGRLQALPVADRYRIKLRTNRSIRWQAQTLPGLAYFDTAILTIES